MAEWDSSSPEIGPPESFQDLLFSLEVSILYGIHLAGKIAESSGQKAKQFVAEQADAVAWRAQAVESYCLLHPGTPPDSIHRLAYSRILGDIAKRGIDKG